MSDKLEQQKTLKELYEEATKDLEYIELPLHDTPTFVSETYEEWLEEMEYEESLLTPEQKEEDEKLSKKQFQMVKQLLKQYHPDHYIDTEMMCEYCLEPTTSYIIDMNMVTNLKDIDVEYRGKRTFCYQCDQERHIDEITQYNKEKCYEKFWETLGKQDPEKVKDIDISHF